MEPNTYFSKFDPLKLVLIATIIILVSSASSQIVGNIDFSSGENLKIIPEELSQLCKISHLENKRPPDQSLASNYEDIVQCLFLWQLLIEAGTDVSALRDMALDAAAVHLKALSPSRRLHEIKSTMRQEVRAELVTIASAIVKNPEATLYVFLPLCMARMDQLRGLDDYLDYKPPTEELIQKARMHVKGPGYDPASLFKPIETWLNRQSK